MGQRLTSGLLWFSAIGCGLIAGVYFAFSAFVMTSLARIAPAAGIAAMNSINVEIVRSLFMPFFLGTTLTAAVLAALPLFGSGQPGSLVALAGALMPPLSIFILPLPFTP